MAATWNDIKRLAGDLQRAQLSGGVKRLSENNCVEVVGKLIASGDIQLYISSDGKEYVTKRHLLTEIRNECLNNGGRVALGELATRLSVDFDAIEASAALIVREKETSSPNTHFLVCSGDLIHRDFIDGLCAQLSERLEEEGQLSIYQLTRGWNLPTEILNNYVLSEVGEGRIKAHRYDDRLYTPHFIESLKRQLVAITTATTKSIPLSAIRDYLDIGQPLLTALWSELQLKGVIRGHLLGSSNSLKSMFVPPLHEKRIAKLVEKMFAQEDFIDRRVLRKLNVADPRPLLSRILSGSDLNTLVTLPNVIIGPRSWGEIVTRIDEQLTVKEKNEDDDSHFGGHCVVDECLPAALLSSGCMEASDYEKLAELVCRKNASFAPTADMRVLFNREETRLRLIDSLRPLLEKKAERDAPEIMRQLRSQSTAKQSTAGAKQQNAAADDEEDWELDAGRKGGNKGGKKSQQPAKKGGKRQPVAKGSQTQSSSTPAGSAIAGAAISEQELLDQLHELSEECQLPDEIVDELKEELLSSAMGIYREAVERALQGMHSALAKEHRREHEERIAALRQLYTSICCFDEGAGSLEDKSLGEDLKRHLVRTLGVEFADLALALASSSTQHVGSSATKLREGSLMAVGDERLRNTLRTFYGGPNAITIEEFQDGVEKLAEHQGFAIGKPDKKTRASFVTTYAEEMRQQLAAGSPDPPTTLLLLVLVIFARMRSAAIHASGKFVSQLVQHLKDAGEGIPVGVLESLASAEKLVIAIIRNKSTSGHDELLSEFNDKVAVLERYLEE